MKSSQKNAANLSQRLRNPRTCSLSQGVWCVCVCVFASMCIYACVCVCVCLLLMRFDAAGESEQRRPSDISPWSHPDAPPPVKWNWEPNAHTRNHEKQGKKLYLWSKHETNSLHKTVEHTRSVTITRAWTFLRTCPWSACSCSMATTSWWNKQGWGKARAVSRKSTPQHKKRPQK